MLSPDEKEILDYLQPLGNQFVSAREICRRAGGKLKYLKEPEWAKPVLKRMERKGLLEINEIGHYRIKPPEEEPEERKKKRTFPVSPHIKQILAKSGKDFTKVYLLEDKDSYPPGPDDSAGHPKKTK